MNITYIIGLVAAIVVFLLGCVLGINIGPKAAGLPPVTFTPTNLWNFFKQNENMPHLLTKLTNP